VTTVNCTVTFKCIFALEGHVNEHLYYYYYYYYYYRYYDELFKQKFYTNYTFQLNNFNLLI